MKKARLPIIITASILSVLLMAGYLLFYKDSPDIDNPINKNKDVVTASAVSKEALLVPKETSDNYTYIPPTYEYDDNNEEDNEEDIMQNPEPTKAPWTPATEMDLDPTSITVYVNKEYCLPKNYVPENLVMPDIAFDISGISERKHMRIEAARAIEQLFAAALDEGVELYGVSGYRSYERQKEIFLNNIVYKGKKHTLKYSAVPGTSEHQTGLAMDVSSKSVRYKLVTSFAKCKEGLWLADNAHKFGFIIRYPKDHYETTGYAYEPWHIRFVGEDLANYLYTNNLTLDEYYKYEPSEGFNFEELYADLINYEPPITPTPIPEEELPGMGLTDPLDEEDIDGEFLEEDDLTDEDTEDEGMTEDLPDDQASDKDTSDKDASKEDGSEDKDTDKTSDSNNPDKDASDSKSPDSKSPDDNNPDKDASDSKSPDSKSPDDKSPDKETSDGKSPDKDASDDKSSDKEVSDSKSPDKGTSESKNPKNENPDNTDSGEEPKDNITSGV